MIPIGTRLSELLFSGGSTCGVTWQHIDSKQGNDFALVLSVLRLVAIRSGNDLFCTAAPFGR